MTQMNYRYVLLSLNAYRYFAVPNFPETKLNILQKTFISPHVYEREKDRQRERKTVVRIG